MRRRMIDPAFWNDSKIIELSIPARLLYIGLWQYADDDGFFLDDLPAIKRTLFPDQKFDIHGAFTECSRFLKRYQYTKESGKDAFAWQISHFQEWQTINRATPSKIKIHCILTDDSLMTLEDSLLSKDKISKDKISKDKTPPPAAFVLPDWIKKEIWDGFEEMRNKERHPLTDMARRGIVNDLGRLKNSGDDPNECLNRSVVNGWRGVFPSRNTNGNKQITPITEEDYNRILDEERKKHGNPH